MKTRWTIVVSAVLGLAVLAQAQQPARRGRHFQRDGFAGPPAAGAQACPGPLRGPGPVWDQLGLTEEQRTRLAEWRQTNAGAWRQTAQDLRARAQQGELTDQQVRAQMAQLRARHRQELAGILTPEQLARLDAWRAAEGPARWGRPGGPRPALGPHPMRPGQGRGPAPPWERLGLTEEQKTRLAEVRQAMEDIRSKVRGGELTRAQARTRMEELREQRLQDLAGILTPEQLEQLQALRAGRRHPAAAAPLEEAQPAPKPSGVQQDSWGSIKYQFR